MTIIEFLTAEPATALVLLLLGERGVSYYMRPSRRQQPGVDEVFEQVRRLYEWHKPETTPDGATQRFGWKFTRGEIQALDDMPRVMRQIVEELRLLRSDLRETLKHRHDDDHEGS